MVTFQSMKKQLLTAVLIFFAAFLYAQKPQQVLQKLKDSFPQERIHIHFDKEMYMAGETIWFKAYLFFGFLPSDLSANFVAELIDQNNHIILQKKLPVLSATVNGFFDVPDTLTQGNYVLRAYTPWMLNFDEAFIYRKPFFIYKPTQQKISPVNESIDYRVDFFPEGGELIRNVVNVVAFKATDYQGMPVQISGRLLDQSGAAINTFSTIHDGMGSFGLLSKSGEQYQAEIIFPDSSKRRFELPTVKENGWVLQVREESETKRRIILAGESSNDIADLVLIGHMQHELLFEQTLQVQGSNSIISLDTRAFPTGILQLTLFTKSGIPLAERLLFVNNNDYRMPVNLQADTVSLRKKAKNVLSFSLPDSIVGSYSVSVVDIGRLISSNNSEDIVSRFLLTSDLKGYIHQPSFYFRNHDKATRMALDLVMMTHGWRRFQWNLVLKDQFPVLHYRDQNHIQLSGTIYSERTKKPVEGGEANFFLRTKDSLTDFFQVPIGKDGRFAIEDLVYSDSAQFSFQYNSKKNRDKVLYIELDKDTVNYLLTGSRLLTSTPNNFPFYKPVSDSLNALFSFATDTSGNYRLLETVTVTAKKKRPVEELNKRYTTGLFSSMNMVRILDLVNNDPGAGALNVFQYIQGRIGSGVRVIQSGNPPTYILYSPRAMSLTGGPIAIPMFLDEAPTTSTQLASIPMHEIAMIKFFQTGFMGNPGVGSTQALAVYSKKASDTKIIGPGYLNAFIYPGYSPVREFYSPDYEQAPATREMPDRRITLLWQPELKVDPDSGKYLIRFFNSDSAKRLKIIVEGVTADGKLVREEKILD